MATKKRTKSKGKARPRTEKKFVHVIGDTTSVIQEETDRLAGEAREALRVLEQRACSANGNVEQANLVYVEALRVLNRSRTELMRARSQALRAELVAAEYEAALKPEIKRALTVEQNG